MPRRRNPYNRPPLTVEHDSDGGLTIHDPQSNLVVSLVSTHPAASGPRGLYVEVYAYNGGPVPWQDASRPGDNRHPTIAFYARTGEDD